MESFDPTKVIKFHPSVKGRIVTREGGKVEFKESFNWDSRDDYGKTMAAFANSGGGYLIFGVKDKPRDLVGLNGENFELLDEAVITTYLNSAFAPEIHYDKRVFRLKGKKVGVLTVHETESKPVVCLKNDRGIKEAGIYYRYIGKSEKIKYPQLSLILAKEREKNDEKWRNLLKNIGKISDVSTVAVIDNKEGSLVRITDDPAAPSMRIQEDPTIGGYKLKYHDIIKKMHERVARFKADKKFLGLMRQFSHNQELVRTRYLYLDNQKGPKTRRFHPRILDELEKNY